MRSHLLACVSFIVWNKSAMAPGYRTGPSRVVSAAVAGSRVGFLKAGVEGGVVLIGQWPLQVHNCYAALISCIQNRTLGFPERRCLVHNAILAPLSPEEMNWLNEQKARLRNSKSQRSIQQRSGVLASTFTNTSQYNNEPVSVRPILTQLLWSS